MKYYYCQLKYIFKTLTKPHGTTFEIRGVRMNRFQYLRQTIQEMDKFYKDIILRAKFGKGRQIHIREWRFLTRDGAKLFGKIFLRHNPKCAAYTIIGY